MTQPNPPFQQDPAQLQPSYQVPQQYQPQGTPLQPERSLGGNLTKALLAGLAAVVVGALVWGGLAYFTERIFVYVAIIIGFAVSFAITLPFKRPIALPVALILFIPALVFTAASVLLGDFFYATLLVAKELNIGISAAAAEVAPIYFDVITEGGEAIKSLLFALLGAGLGFYNAVKPK
jgi:hypothetical protein